MKRPSGSRRARTRLELVPARVARRQRRRRLEVELAPVGPAAVVVHDVLDALEVLVVGRALVHVHRDVGGRRARARCAAGCRRRATTRTSTGKLIGTPSVSTSARTRFSASTQVLARDGVLHLVEAHEPGTGEHRVARPTYSDRPDARHQLRPRRGMSSGRRRPMRHVSVEGEVAQHVVVAALARHRGRGATGSSVRLLRLVSAHRVPGTQKNSKWSLASTISPRSRSSTSSTGSARSTAWRLNAGTHCSVTVESDAERADADPGHVEHVGVLVRRSTRRPSRRR